MSDILYERIKMLGIDPEKEKIDMLKDYYRLLVETNRSMNLTSITGYEDVVNKHFVDSLAIANVLEMNNIKNAIDIGTGAGFPGMVIKIMYPEIKMTLVDSLNKRILFLETISERFGLKSLQIIHSRAEDLARVESHRENYELCVSRAVANLLILAEYCLPFVKKQGLFIPYKSSDIQEELEKAKNTLKTLGGKITDIKKMKLPGTDIKRSFIFILKEDKTPDKYPRKPGIIKKTSIPHDSSY